MIIKKRSFLEKEDLTQPVKQLTERLLKCSDEEMVAMMQEEVSKPWNGLIDDLFHYIDVLNRMDKLLSLHVDKYDLNSEYPKLLHVDAKDNQLIVTCLAYTYSLLEHCSNKSVYSSAERVHRLLLSTSIDIRVASLKLICLMCERFSSSENSRCTVPPKVRNLLLKMARVFPSQSMTVSPKPQVESKTEKKKERPNTIKYLSLLDCISPTTNVPPEWGTLDFEYYSVGKPVKKETQSESTTTSPLVSPKKKKLKKRSTFDNNLLVAAEAGTEGIRHLYLSPETVQRMPIQNIYDCASEVISKDLWNNFITAVDIARAYSSSNEESLYLRQKLTTMKCLAVAAASSYLFYSVLASTIFDEEPYLLSYMSDLVNRDNDIPYETSFAALRAFVNISSKKTGGSDLMRAWGGNVGHGLLFHMLKSILKDSQEDKLSMPEPYLHYVFKLVGNLVDNKRLVSHLRNAGLLNILMEFIMSTSDLRITRSESLHLIGLFIKFCPEVLDDFIERDGFNALINLLGYEVNFAIDNPDYQGGAPKDRDLSFQITVPQVYTMHALLKLVHQLITEHPGDRMRNLYDSAILQSFIKILNHPKLFGYDLLTSTLRIIVGIINSEPTAYAILDEGHVIDTFFDQFDKLLVKSADLLLEIPGTMSAIALNHGGHSRVKSSNLIPRFFTIFRNEEICRNFLKEDNCLALGQEIDELARHHPGLKSSIDTSVLQLFDDIPNSTQFPQLVLWQSPHRSFYYSRDEPVEQNEEGCKELVTWETCKEGDILECTAVFVSVLFDNSRIWKNLYSKADIEKIIRFITVPNTPYDYVLSNALYSISSTIKAIDQSSPCFALHALLKELGSVLESLHDFTHYSDDSTSYFDQFDRNDPMSATEGGEAFSKLGKADCILYVLSDVYGSPNKLPSNRILSFAKEFASDDGLSLINELVLFYRRIALEEVIFHSRTPSDAAKDVISVNQGITRYHVEIGCPNEKSASREGTSAKSKNLSTLFFHFSRSQSWMRYIFASICRLTNDRRSDNRFGMGPKYSVAVLLEYVNTTVDVLTKINTSNQEIECGYTLLMLNQLYSTMFMRPRTTDPINAAMVITLFQNGGMIKMREIAIRYFALLKTFPHEDVEKYTNAKYVDIDSCSTTILVLSQILGIYSGVSTKSMISIIPSQERFYPDLTKDTTPYSHELGSSIMVQSSLASFGLLNELLNPDNSNILENHPENIPIPLIEKLIVISKNFYTSVSTTQSFVFEGRLYPLSYRNTAPSSDKVDYLCSLGFDRDSALEVLTFYGNSVEELYIPDPNLMDEEDFFAQLAENMPVDGFDLEEICTKASEGRYVAQTPAPIPPQYQHVCTLDDVNFSRGANESNFIDYWIQMAQIYPKAVFRISDLLLGICSKNYLFVTEVIDSVYTTVCSFSFDDDDKENMSKLSSMLLLLSYLIDDKTLNRHPDIGETIASNLTEEVTSQRTNLPWFSSALKVLEKLVAHSKLPKTPKADKTEFECKLPAPLTVFDDNWSLNIDLELKLFETLISVPGIDEPETASSIARLLILMCDRPERCADVCSTDVLRNLIECVRKNTDTTSNVQSVVINLLRRCMEDQTTIDAYMECDINKAIQSRKGTLKRRERDLSSVCKENSSLILRDDDSFVNTLSRKSVLSHFEKPLKSMSIVAVSPEQQKFLDSKGYQEVKEIVPNKPTNTGIMQLLLSELMILSKKDLISSPDDSNEEPNDNKDSDEDHKGWYMKDEMFKNTDLAYALFLMQSIAELLLSYKGAKTEFLTFSKRGVDTEAAGKPKSTALNLFIHRLIFSDPFKKVANVETKRRRLLSQFASVCIFSLISTVPLKDADYSDPKICDPDLVFVRKFTVDMLIKALQSENSGKVNALVRYGKIVDILDVVCKLLGDSFELSVASAFDSTITRDDDFHIAKELIDRKFSFLLTCILADLDVNFPYTEQISSAIMRCLSSLGEVKVEDQGLFKSEGGVEGDEDIINEEEEVDVHDNMPNLLQNSTLGMYDVDEIEDELDEDDMDDDILNDNDIEIVYSSDEGSNSDEDMGSVEEEYSDGDDVDIIFEEEVGDSDEEGDDVRYIDQNDPNISIEVIEDDSDVSGSDYYEDEDMEPEEDFDMDEGGIVINEDSEADSDSGSDDDSAILDAWINGSHDHDRSRRASRTISAAGFDDSSDDDAYGVNYMARPPHGTIEILPPEEARERNETPFSLLELPGSGLSRDYQDGTGPFMTFNFGSSLEMGNGTLADILRAFERHGSNNNRRHQRVPNIFLKSTTQRWLEVAHFYYSKTMTKEACRVIPSVLNGLYEKSELISQEEARKRAEKEEQKRLQREEREKARKETEIREAAEREQENSLREPVYVTIGGEPVDISGTDIDPEFLQALPEEMRVEVFTSHVRQRRIDASHEDRSREVDGEFLDALPEDLRSAIEQDDAIHDMAEDEEDVDGFVESTHDDNTVEETSRHKEKKTGSKVFFPAMTDRYGVAAMLKMLFVPELYYKRESFFKTISYLCYNRHTRADIIALLLYTLTESVNQQVPLDSLFHYLCTKARMGSIPGTEPGKSAAKPTAEATFRLPTGCSTLTVATQTIDVIQYLLENENQIRFHFLTDQEGYQVTRKVVGHKHKLKDTSYRYPVNVLLALLDKPLIKEDSNLMDVLTRSIQISTTPLQAMKQKITELKGDDEAKFSKKPRLPIIPDRDLRLIVDTLAADECPSKVFQQTIASIQNLSTLDNAKVVFPHELSQKAMELSANIARDLRALVKDLEKYDGDLEKIKSLASFSSASSDQAKLLRVLTALDYLFQSEDSDSSETKELRELYRNSALGPLWGALSDCLKILHERTNLVHVTTILSPLIEALMVVCKHSKVTALPVSDVLAYEQQKRYDFSSAPIESLFFTFTETHKKILNQMIRDNPKLMSGPFSVLIRNPKVLEFDNKRAYFQQKLHKDDETRTDLSVTIRRDQVFLDSYRAIFFKPPDTIRQSHLEIHFRGEEGVDAGGLTREWYQVLSRQIFNPDYALFTATTSDRSTFHPNRASWVNPEHLSFFKFVGMIIGKAVFDGFMLDCHFTRAVFKKILGKPASLKDMESLDPNYYKSLVWMLENNITDIIVETFSVEADDYGEHKIIDLKPNGRNISVTEENKQEYVQEIVQYKLINSVKDQLNNFLEGFYEIIPKELVSIFDEQELELLISGLPDIDVDDWKNNTSYVNYSVSSAQIQWFWRAVKSFDTEERAKLLQFATGTSKVPLNGFQELSGVDGVSKFSIHRVYSSVDRLPSAHTCFNQIDLPEYESYEKLRAALLLAVREGHEGFGFV